MGENKMTEIILMVFLFVSVFAISWVIMSILWLILDYQSQKHEEKCQTIKKIAIETGMSRENVEKLYDLFMD